MSTIIGKQARDINDIKTFNRVAGYHFFEASTMRFFNSRIGRTVYGDKYFITSEQFDNNSPRLYSIREISASGDIETIGGFQNYETAAAARQEIKKLIDN